MVAQHWGTASSVSQQLFMWQIDHYVIPPPQPLTNVHKGMHKALSYSIQAMGVSYSQMLSSKFKLAPSLSIAPMMPTFLKRLFLLNSLLFWIIQTTRTLSSGELELVPAGHKSSSNPLRQESDPEFKKTLLWSLLPSGMKISAGNLYCLMSRELYTHLPILQEQSYFVV